MGSRTTWRREGSWCPATLVAVILALASGACGASTPVARRPATSTPHSTVGSTHDQPTVVLIGDSLSAQAAPDFDHLVEAAGAKVTNYVYGGTALCAWIPAIGKVAPTRPTDAVIEFVGTTFSTCMQGCRPESAAAITKYCSDLEHAFNAFFAVDTHVFVIGTPITYQQWISHDPHWDDLNNAFRALAMQYPGQVTYVDAGVAVEGPGHSFTWTLPCLSSEPCTGPTVNGVQHNVVRAPDGVHFCPPTVPQLGCGDYSSGAYRFAAAMASPVVQFVDPAKVPHHS